MIYLIRKKILNQLPSAKYNSTHSQQLDKNSIFVLHNTNFRQQISSSLHVNINHFLNFEW